MHLLADLFFAAAAPAPSPQPAMLMNLLFYSTVPAFIMAAINGRSLVWGVFQLVWLIMGIYAFWRWTDGCANGVRMIGIYVVYSCLNLMCVLLFIAVSSLSHGALLLWPIAAFALDVFIAVMTVRIVRNFPEPKQ
jgi:hypothetical protein